MTSLKNLLRHMRGQVVRVNGTNYNIDADGIAHDLKSEDAEKLLKGQAWELLTPRVDPEPALLSDDGEPVTDPDKEPGEGEPGEPVGSPSESMDLDDLKAMADKLGVAYGTNIGKALLVERIEEAMTSE